MLKTLRPLLLLAFLSWTSFSVSFAQTVPPSNLSESSLRTWLRQNWYDGKRIELDYSTARGKMYNYVDNYNNTITCVYSGYEQPFTYSETNTSTSIPNINCEHTVPQSWFNEVVRMRTDIHHLFPTVIQWNSDRGSDPFAEIPDNQTLKWIRLLSSQSTIPTSNIDDYSEDTNSQFEPREVHKGNLARAIFYFYTMHEGQAFDAGKNIITAAGDLQTLYQWHLQDPVDAKEVERNDRIQQVQGNRNPYIDYPELVAKAWGLTPVSCSPTTQASQLSITQTTPRAFTLNWTNGSGNRRLVVVKEGSAANFSPTGSYSTGVNADFSQATDQGSGQKIVYSGSGSSVTVTGLTATRTYHVQVFEFCSSDNVYNTTAAPVAQTTLPDYTCAGVPSQVVANVMASNVTTGGFTLTFTAGNGDGRLVLVKAGSAPSAPLQNGTAYTTTTQNFANAPALSDGSKILYSSTGTTVDIMGLSSNTEYYVTVVESCTNGYQYAAGSAPIMVKTETAGGTLPSGVLARQDFENSSDDGWEVLSGFSSAADNTGYPANQRVKSGSKSLQVSATTSEVIFQPVTTTGYRELALELFNSSVSKTTGNGMDLNDHIEVYTALNGASFSATPDLRITADASDNNIRYDMNGTGVLETTAGTPVVKTFVKASAETGDLSGDAAPSRLIVRLPNGTSSVQLKVVLKNNSSNEVFNVDDVTLYGTFVTGVAPDLEAQVRVFPNPTSGLVTVQLPAGLGAIKSSLYNATGQQVAAPAKTRSSQSLTLDLQHVPKGLYFLHLSTDKGTLVRRLVVQ